MQAKDIATKFSQLNGREKPGDRMEFVEPYNDKRGNFPAELYFDTAIYSYSNIIEFLNSIPLKENEDYAYYTLSRSEGQLIFKKTEAVEKFKDKVNKTPLPPFKVEHIYTKEGKTRSIVLNAEKIAKTFQLNPEQTKNITAIKSGLTSELNIVTSDSKHAAELSEIIRSQLERRQKTTYRGLIRTQQNEVQLSFDAHDHFIEFIQSDGKELPFSIEESTKPQFFTSQFSEINKTSSNKSKIPDVNQIAKAFQLSPELTGKITNIKPGVFKSLEIKTSNPESASALEEIIRAALQKENSKEYRGLISTHDNELELSFDALEHFTQYISTHSNISPLKP